MRAVPGSMPGLKISNTRRSDCPRSMVTPIAVNRVIAGTPRNSAHSIQWRVSSIRVSPTSKQTARMGMSGRSIPWWRPEMAFAIMLSERHAGNAGRESSAAWHRPETADRWSRQAETQPPDRGSYGRPVSPHAGGADQLTGYGKPAGGAAALGRRLRGKPAGGRFRQDPPTQHGGKALPQGVRQSVDKRVQVEPGQRRCKTRDCRGLALTTA